MPSLYLPPKCFECKNPIKGNIHYCLLNKDNKKSNRYVNLCSSCLSIQNEKLIDEECQKIS